MDRSSVKVACHWPGIYGRNPQTLETDGDQVAIWQSRRWQELMEKMRPSRGCDLSTRLQRSSKLQEWWGSWRCARLLNPGLHPLQVHCSMGIHPGPFHDEDLCSWQSSSSSFQVPGGISAVPANVMVWVQGVNHLPRGNSCGPLLGKQTLPQCRKTQGSWTAGLSGFNFQ